MLRLLFDKFFADFLRVYRVLSPGMRGAVRGIFACVVMLSLLEVGTVLSITFLSVSIAAPEKLRDFGVVARLFGFFPQLDALCEEPRFFALLTSCGVVILIIAKISCRAL